METKKLMRATLAELLGMALFVYIGTGSAVSTGEFLATGPTPANTDLSRILPISFGFGMSILCQAYSFGHISGGHFNPAVTLCLFLVGEVDVITMVAYMVAQVVGATLGSMLLWASVSSHDLGALVGDPAFGLGNNALNPNINQGNGFVFEFMGTMVLCMTVLMTAVHPKSLSSGQPNLAPLAIGFAVFLSHLVLVPFTGCGINPARTFGPALVNSFAGSKVWEDSYWIYFVGPFFASIVAAAIFKFVFVDNDDEEEAAKDDVGEAVDNADAPKDTA